MSGGRAEPPAIVAAAEPNASGELVVEVAPLEQSACNIPQSQGTDVMHEPLPDAVVEDLAELWCEALLANLRRHPIETPRRRAS